MGLQRVESIKGGRFAVEFDEGTFEMPDVERRKDPNMTTQKLRAKLAESGRKALPIAVEYYKDIDGNEYVFTGGIPPVLPNTQREERG